jgi:hypothetical protein
MRRPLDRKLVVTDGLVSAFYRAARAGQALDCKQWGDYAVSTKVKSS